jgi:hypothetical protein
MKYAAAALALLVAVNSLAATNCNRDELQSAAEAYLEAQRAGDRDALPAAPVTRYFEQQQPVSPESSIINTPLAIDFHRSILDETTCQTFTELVVLDEAHPYAIGTRLRVVAGTITELEAMVTDEGDWLFNPQVTFERSSAESWEILPENARSDRATLEAAANAYFDQFFSGPGTVEVPWGRPCNRLEGGAYTGNGSAEDSCDVGVPSGMNISHRRFVVDEAMGAVVGFVQFGPNALPDTHLFRLENGRIRYVHTLTVCAPTGCAFN